MIEIKIKNIKCRIFCKFHHSLVAAVLMKKGAKFSNVLIFIGAWSTTKIPMFLFEMSAMGMKWAKWINEIEIVDYDFKGYWESQGWSDYAGRDRPYKIYD